MGAGAVIVSDRRLYLTADRARVVEEGDADAAFLLATPGHTISIGDQKRLGLALDDGRVVIGKKAAKKPADKSAGMPENKSKK